MKPPSRYRKKLKILAIYEVVKESFYRSEEDRISEEDALDEIKIVINALKENGHDVSEMEVYDNFAKEILKWKDSVDIVFNLAEGIDNDVTKVAYPSFILESLGIPFTGCGWESFLLTTDKAKTKELLSIYNIPVTPHVVLNETPKTMPQNLTFPLFVKPVLSDASYGIDKNAVVHSFEQLAERVARVISIYKMPALVEPYVDGMDVHIGIMGNDYDNLDVMLPYGLMYKNLPDDEYPIRTFEEKFNPKSHVAKNSHIVHPAPFDSYTIERIQDISAKIYQICKCSGYARLDFRVDKNMTPYFLEINVNPSLYPEDGFVVSTRDIGLNYNEFIERILSYGYERSLTKSKIYKK
ncbi:hypothetical protein HZA39_02730 [Candidatus Peregrinibacteria bacterium]|nr:hypothetical protein [Candidatus Peregrinibacteria bacterium]